MKSITVKKINSFYENNITSSKPIRIVGRLHIPIVLILIMVTGCAQAANLSGETNSRSQQPITRKAISQLIIQFRHNSFDPSKADFVEKLSQDAQTPLEYLRPMSGGNHVFRVKNVSDPKQLDVIIKRLSVRPDIVYVEKDNILVRSLQKQPE